MQKAKYKDKDFAETSVITSNKYGTFQYSPTGPMVYSYSSLCVHFKSMVGKSLIFTAIIQDHYLQWCDT